MSSKEEEEATTAMVDKQSSKPVPAPAAFGFSLLQILASIGVAIATETWYECMIAFGVHYISFAIYGWPYHSEKFYDFTGMIAFLSVDLFAVLYYPDTLTNIVTIITFLMPFVWTLRLGLFLFNRILGEHCQDIRFDAHRNNFASFFMCWTMSGVWVYFCILPVLVVLSHASQFQKNNVSLLLVFIGCIVWLFGFIFEIIADNEKSRFKSNVNNRGKFIKEGLWSISRHPNYFGEIVLWLGLAIVASSVANGWEWLMYLSPIWSAVLLTTMSGIPASEVAFKRKYGNLKEYREYKDNTPVLIPFCFCWK